MFALAAICAGVSAYVYYGISNVKATSVRQARGRKPARGMRDSREAAAGAVGPCARQGAP